MPRVHAARFGVGWVHIGVRHLPLQPENELKHQQHGSHPVCEPVAHDVQGTRLITLKKEARLCASPARAVSADGRRLPVVRSRIQ
jgi:hypothetical protein